MKRLIIVLLVLVCLFPIMANGQKESKSGDDFKLVLRLSHVFSPEEQLTKSMDLVANRIYEKTNGAIDIKTFPQGQLATYKDGVQQVVQGSNFISVEDPSYLGDYVPDFKALVGPMLYKTYDEYTQMCKTPLVQDMVKKVEDNNIKVLALNYIFGFRNIIANKPVKNPSDLKGVKLRTPGSNLFIDTINAMGATAVSLPFSETLSAVQQGVVDGLEGSEFTNIGTKVYETPAKYVAKTGHFLGTCGVYFPLDVWNTIPAKYQTIIADEFEYGATEMTELLKSQIADVTKELEGYGVVFNDVDTAAFTKATSSVFADMEGLTPGVYNQILENLAEIRK